jgi:hypothetical protein
LGNKVKSLGPKTIQYGEINANCKEKNKTLNIICTRGLSQRLPVTRTRKTIIFGQKSCGNNNKTKKI